MSLESILISNPKISVIVISFLITLFMTLVTKKFTDQNRMKELKGIQKACQIKIKDNKHDPEEMKRINKEMMGCSMELMKHSFKPMLYTFLPVILVFWWIRGTFSETFPKWLWWYIGTSVISNMALRKALKVV